MHHLKIIQIKNIRKKKYWKHEVRVRSARTLRSQLKISGLLPWSVRRKESYRNRLDQSHAKTVEME